MLIREWVTGDVDIFFKFFYDIIIKSADMDRGRGVKPITTICGQIPTLGSVFIAPICQNGKKKLRN